MLNKMRDAVGDDAGLAAARAGQDEDWAFGSLNSLALLGIELIEKRQSGRGSGSDDLILQGNGEVGCRLSIYDRRFDSRGRAVAT
jgi:hypothetical protein